MRAGDLFGWLDQRLADARAPALARVGAEHPQTAASEAIWSLAEVDGIGLKVAALMLADLLLVDDPRRQAWVAAGAEAVAVDTLVHNFSRRTRILRRLGAEHCGSAQGQAADRLRSGTPASDSESFSNWAFSDC